MNIEKLSQLSIPHKIYPMIFKPGTETRNVKL